MTPRANATCARAYQGGRWQALPAALAVYARLAPGAALTLCAAACQAPARPLEAFPLTLVSHSDHGEPVEGTRLWVAGRSLGTSNPDGELSTTVRGARGDTITLVTTCPPGFETRTPERRVTLGHALREEEPRAGEHRAPAAARLVVRVVCRALEHRLAVVVRSAPGLPVLLDGLRVGQTNEDGLEHVLMTVAPGSRLQLGLDTTRDPKLLPQVPVKTFRVPGEDTLLVWDQPVVRPPPPRPKRSPRPPPPPPKPRPRRIR